MVTRKTRLLVLLVMAVAAPVLAQEPETLPPPRQKQPAPAAPPYYIPYPPPAQMVVPSVLPPLNSREGWMYFAPNSYGQMRPRVIMSPYVDYYLYNGRPYYGRSVGYGFELRKTAGND